jgi:hypothetical protein
MTQLLVLCSQKKRPILNNSLGVVINVREIVGSIVKLKFCATDNSGHCKLWDIDGNIATPEHLRSNITEKNPWTGSIYSTSSQQIVLIGNKRWSFTLFHIIWKLISSLMFIYIDFHSCKIYFIYSFIQNHKIIHRTITC